MRLKDIMTANLETIAADQSVRQACDMMKRLNVGVLPVLEDSRMVLLPTGTSLHGASLPDSILMIRSEPS